MSSVATDEIEVEPLDRFVRIGGKVLVAGQIKHIIVNADTDPTDDVAGSIVVETSPPYGVGTLEANQLQLDVTDAQALAELARFSEANNITVTSTSLDNQRFHDMFWVE